MRIFKILALSMLVALTGCSSAAGKENPADIFRDHTPCETGKPMQVTHSPCVASICEGFDGSCCTDYWNEDCALMTSLICVPYLDPTICDPNPSEDSACDSTDIVEGPPRPDCGWPDAEDSISIPPTGSTLSVNACLNGKMDEEETGVDCGGSCRGCNAGEVCLADADCAEQLQCLDGVCLPTPHRDERFINEMPIPIQNLL